MATKDEIGRPTTENTANPPSAILVAPRAVNPIYDLMTYTGPAIQMVLRQGGLGELGKQLTMFTKMIESDSHLSSTVQTRRKKVGKAPQTILPAEGMEEDSKAVMAAEYARQVTPNIIGWNDFMRSAIDGPVKGFYGAEIVWSGPIPIQLADTPDNGWRWYEGLQYRNNDGQWIQVPADKFVIHAPRGNSASFVRRGIMRAIARYWLIKAVATGDWSSFVELFGIPYRHIEYPDNVQPGDPALNKIIQAVQQMGASGVVATKKGFTLNFPTSSSSGAGASGSPHESLVRWCDAQISKDVLGQTLTTDSTQSTGTYSLGVIHNEIRLDWAQDDADDICDTVERDLFEPMIRYGLGPDYPTPRLVITIEGPSEAKDRAEVLDVAVNRLGLPVSKETAYEDLRIEPPPENIEEDDLLEGAPASEPAFFAMGHDGHQRFIAEGVTAPNEPAQTALDELAATAAADWALIERESIPQAMANLLRRNPEITPSEFERQCQLMYLNHDPDEMAQVLLDTMGSSTIDGSLESELETPTPTEEELAALEEEALNE